MIVYNVAPIDNWAGWRKPSDIFRVSDAADPLLLSEWLDPATWLPMWEKAQELAKKIDWEGDIREGPYVSVLPAPLEIPGVVIAWKQDNNGTTFVATPYELPWLEHDGRISG